MGFFQQARENLGFTIYDLRFAILESYVPVGSAGVAEELARPSANIIYFAGEATAPDGQQGTVGSALARGQRAARQHNL